MSRAKPCCGKWYDFPSKKYLCSGRRPTIGKSTGAWRGQILASPCHMYSVLSERFLKLQTSAPLALTFTSNSEFRSVWIMVSGGFGCGFKIKISARIWCFLKGIIFEVEVLMV